VTEEGSSKPEKVGKVSSRRVYSGKIVALDIDQVRFPDGKIGELEIIRHPGASAVVPFLDSADDPQVLLIKQYRYAANGYVYEIPAGRIDPGETPEQCAKRELREETGYRAGKVSLLSTIYTTPGFIDEKIHLFAAEDLTGGSVQQEPDEFMELHPMPLSQVVGMIRSGEIVDGKSIAGLLLAYLSRKTQ
jgi:ADP-ribose pyrophosphatase